MLAVLAVLAGWREWRWKGREVNVEITVYMYKDLNTSFTQHHHSPTGLYLRQPANTANTANIRENGANFATHHDQQGQHRGA